MNFKDTIAEIGAIHRPSRMPFFQRLAEKKPTSEVLGQIHLVYQSAMHATRAAVYMLPHLDAPAMRRRKLQIYVDDDGLPNGDTHHYQLTRAFQNIGGRLLINDEEFDDRLWERVDPITAHFITTVEILYRRSLGAWCVVEYMSDDWMRALAKGLSVHWPMVAEEPYFAECFAGAVEERHAAESMEITQLVLNRRPELVAGTVADAWLIAAALDNVWIKLNEILS